MSSPSLVLPVPLTISSRSESVSFVLLGSSSSSEDEGYSFPPARSWRSVKKESEAVQGCINFLQKSIASLHAHPEINQIDHTTHQLAKHKVPRIGRATPICTPVAGNRATTPVPAPSNGCTFSGSGLSRPSFFRSLVSTPQTLFRPLQGCQLTFQVLRHSL